MKLAHPMLNNPINWDDNFINTFVIENPKMYRTFLEELYDQEQGMKGDFVLSQGLELLDISKNIEIIPDLLRMDTGDNKKIITGIIKEFTSVAINDNHLETYELYRAINNLISNVIFESGNELKFDEINDISQIFKMYNIRPDDDNLTLAEKILLHMELCEKYLRKKLFVLLNFHSYFTKIEMVNLFTDFIYRKYNIFIIERYDYEATSLEQKRIIDADLCEI